MLSVPAGVRVWLASGPTDMRRGMNSLSLLVQEVLGRNPHGGDLFVFRGRRGDLLKVLWADDLGMSLYLKRLERGRFVWPTASGGVRAASRRAADAPASLAGKAPAAATADGRWRTAACGNRR